MRIASTSLQLESSSSRLQQHQLSESLDLRVSQTSPRLASRAVASAPAAPTVQISEAGKSAQSSEASAIQEGLGAADNDPRLLLIKALVSMLMGHEVNVFDSSSLEQPGGASRVDSAPASVGAPPASGETAQAAAGVAASYSRQESYSESEQTSVRAAGVVRTADGKEISFSLSLEMSRSFQQQTNVSVQSGQQRATKDPLVINFGASSTQLTSQRFSFDLDSDGQKEDINFAAGGSGFLAFDRNADGRINNGQELFGAQSGDGFAELSALDDDGNGWIDSGDSAYGQLRIWSHDSSGKDKIVSLAQAGIGALSTASVASEFSLKDAGNSLLGQIRSTGVYLREDGGVGSVQQVDLTV